MFTFLIFCKQSNVFWWTFKYEINNTNFVCKQGIPCWGLVCGVRETCYVTLSMRLGNFNFYCYRIALFSERSPGWFTCSKISEGFGSLSVTTNQTKIGGIVYVRCWTDLTINAKASSWYMLFITSTTKLTAVWLAYIEVLKLTRLAAVDYFLSRLSNQYNAFIIETWSLHERFYYSHFSQTGSWENFKVLSNC